MTDWKKRKDGGYLGLRITMVDRVDEAVGAQGVAKLWCELSASFDSVSFREVDDCKISETH